MHGEVVAALAVLPRAVERVDDPEPVGAEPAEVAVALLGEQRVAGAVLGQPALDEDVRLAVGGVAQLAVDGAVVLRRRAERAAYLEQQAAGLLGHLARQHAVVELRLRRHELNRFCARSRPSSSSSSTASAASETSSGSSLRSTEAQGLST